MVSLIPIQIEHHALIKEWYHAPEFEEYFRRFPPLFTWDNADMIQRFFAASYIIREEDECVGIVSLIDPDYTNKKVEFGIMIDPERVEDRRNACVASLQQIGAYVFDYLRFNKLQCLVLSQRKSFQVALDSFNFQFEGLLKDNVFWKGEYHDEVSMCLLEKDYRRL